MNFVHESLLIYGILGSGAFLLLALFVEWLRTRRIYKILGSGLTMLFSRYIAVMAVAALLVGAFAQPYVYEEGLVKALEDAYVMMLFDESRSMGARVNPDAKNRLERSKDMSLDMLPFFRNSMVGVYGFTDVFGPLAGFSTDHVHIKDSIEELVQIESVTGTGGVLANALNRAAQQFPKDTDKKKFIILFSDGGKATTRSDVRLKDVVLLLKKRDIKIISIGVGELEPVAIGEKSGITVISSLEEATLKEIADITGGVYVRELGNEDVLGPSGTFLTAAFGEITVAQRETRDVSYVFVVSALVVVWVLWFFFGNRKRITSRHI